MIVDGKFQQAGLRFWQLWQPLAAAHVDRYRCSGLRVPERLRNRQSVRIEVTTVPPQDHAVSRAGDITDRVQR